MKFIKYIVVGIEIGWCKFLRLFNIRKSIKPIPDKTPYCYVIDYERNLKEPLESGYYVKECKYFRTLGKGDVACTFTGFMGWDPCLSDSCKICGKKSISDSYEVSDMRKSELC